MIRINQQAKIKGLTSWPEHSSIKRSGVEFTVYLFLLVTKLCCVFLLHVGTIRKRESNYKAMFSEFVY